MKPKMTTVANFSIHYFRYLNPEGVPEQDVPDFAKQKEPLLAIYRNMLLSRLFDKKAIALQRTGKIGTYPSILGQEAIGTGIGAAMAKEDIYCPYYREHGALFWRGVKMEELLQYWGGDERGSNWADNRHDFPCCVPIASQTLQAAGAATAIKIRQQKRAVVTTVGDGGTSRGDFYEAMNIAGVWNLPVVFVINNNQWAISVPRSKQTKSQTLAQKAIAAGIEGYQIDGNDVLAVKDSVARAAQKAREGNGPTVIEALSYRMGDHTTADDAKRYRPEHELEENAKYDPLLRLKNYLITQQFWDEAQDKNLTDLLTQEVAKAADIFLNIAPPPPEAMFDWVYDTLPEAYIAQRETVKKGMGA